MYLAVSAGGFLYGVPGPSHTAQPKPRNKPFGPSFFRITLTPWKTPLYMRGASFLAWSSPCNCNLSFCQSTLRDSLLRTDRIFTVSNPWVTVTAPHAAIPPATDPQIAPCHGDKRSPCFFLQVSYTHTQKEIQIKSN